MGTMALAGVLALGASACSGDDSSAAASETTEEPSTVASTAAAESQATDPASTTTTSTPQPDPVAVTGPVTGENPPANASLVDLDSLGYVEEEFFVEGDAVSYALDGERTEDGMWATSEDDSAEYRTRILVRRPADEADFSGVVVVEWLNVTAGFDGDPDWGYLHEELVREGHAYVAVSAQTVGVMGGDPVIENEALEGAVAAEGGLVGSDPERYGTLVHPGDDFSFDIFSQAGAALVNPDGPAPLGDLEPEHLIAAGESQSAFFLTTYLNGVHPHAGIYDGFLVHSRGGGSPALNGSGIEPDAVGRTVHIRTDGDTPVLVFETETDLTELGYLAARQDDTDSVRTWEVAGTAHADAYLLEGVYGVPGGVDISSILGCSTPFNDGPQHEVLQAGFHHLVDWVRDGTVPPEAPRLETSDGESPVIARDENGNALGGIRTPLVDVPVAALSGEPADGGGAFCFLFGSTVSFDAAKLAELYPTHDAYVAAFTESADAAVDAGFLLREDADAMIAEAEASDVGG